ncbi:redoxin domain-containing protein [Paenibacillus sp. GYB004]|uniref:redoxin domain-containing protein n=1 Tax=Paenibacillus sp. GYB004 TaxID=2994393 RepID=UPI002F9650BE
MKRNRRWVQIFILGIAAIIGVIVIMGSVFKEDTSVGIGKKAPDFQLVGLDGKVYSLSDYKGKSVVINFWGTFCPPCVREMPALQAQYEKWKDQDVEFLGINLNESRIAIESFIQKSGVKYPILLDDDRIRKKYRVMSYPTTLYVDANSIIQDIFVGEMTENDIQSRINKLKGDTK